MNWFLTRHFLRSLFDFGILSERGVESYTRLLVGLLGGFYATGLVLARMYRGKYRLLAAQGPEAYLHGVIGDELLILGMPMFVAAFVTVLISHSLFPDERDFRILGPLPVPRATIFSAKLSALLVFTGGTALVTFVMLAPLLFLSSIAQVGEPGFVVRAVSLLVASLTGAVFGVFAIAALVGVLTLSLSSHRLQSTGAAVRSLLVGVLVVSVPLVLRLPALGSVVAGGVPWTMSLPPAWFVGFHRVVLGARDPAMLRLALIAAVGLLLTAGVVAATYILLFRHFERMVLRRSSGSPPWNTLRWPLADRQTPAYRAVSAFTVATLKRSPLHQGVLIGLSACGVGLVVNHFSGGGSSTDIWTTSWVPVTIIFACGIAMRASLVLPLDQHANWIFRVTEDDATRRDQLRAVNRVATAYVLGLALIAAIPLLWISAESGAIAGAIVTALIAIVFVQLVLLNWRRIPFACSYLPGKRFVAHSALLGVVLWLFFTLIGSGLVRNATASPTAAMMFAGVLVVISAWLRYRQHAAWRTTPLLFEDELPDDHTRLAL